MIKPHQHQFLSVPPVEQQPSDGHLEVLVKGCKMRNVMASEQDPIRSYFMLLQLEDQSGAAKPQKFRTDLQQQVFRSEDLVFAKNVFRFGQCNPYERITIRIACFQVEQKRKRAPADMNALSIIQESDVRHSSDQNNKEQAKLLAESEMVATGLLKFDIFEETDKNLDEFAGHPILEDNPLANNEISK